jgi:hypothetical protein
MTAQTPAERMRLHRARKRDGRRVVPVEIDQAVIEDALIRRRFLRREDADDPEKVAAALREAVRQLITPPAKPYDTRYSNAPARQTVR